MPASAVPGTPGERAMPSQPQPLPSMYRPGRRSFAPGSTFDISPAMGRKSLMPRMSTMPSAPNKIGAVGSATVSLSEYQAVKAEVNRSKLQLEAANEKLEEERRARQKKEDEHIIAFKKVAELESKLARNQREVDRTERKAKREEEEKLKGENELKLKMDELLGTLDNVQGDKETTDAKLQQMIEQYEAVQQKLLNAKNENTGLTAAHDDLHNANETLETRLHQLNEDVAETNNKYEQAEGNLVALRATLSDVRDEADAHAKSLNEKIESLTLELDEKTEHVDSLTARIQKSQTQHDALAESKQQVLDRADALSAELEQLQEETRVHKDTHQDVVAELKKAQKKVSELTHKIDALESDIIEKDTALGFKTEQISKEKKDQHSLVEKHRKDMTAAKNHVVDAQAALKLKEDESRDLENAKAELESQIEDLNEENERLKAANENMKTEDAKSMKEAQNSALTMQQQNEELKDQVKDYKRKVQKVEKEVKANKLELDELAQRVEEISRENETLEEANADLDYKVRCEEHNAKKQTLIAEKLRGKVEQKDKDIRELKKSKKALIAQANERIDSMNAETKKLETVANNYRTDYELLKSKLQRQARRRNFSMISNDEEDAEQVSPPNKKRRSLPVRRSVTFGAVDEDDINVNEDEEESELFDTPAASPNKALKDEEAQDSPDDDLDSQEFKSVKAAAKDLGLKV